MTATIKTPLGGAARRNKGAAFERAVASAIRTWFPNVKRSRDNGSINTADTGDIAGTHDRLFWSLKNYADENSGKLGGWLAEAIEKAGPGRIPILVQKRAGHADPLKSWAWLRLGDVTGESLIPFRDRWLRMELSTAVYVLAVRGHLPTKGTS